ncbi:MAG TPA: Xaa-Pro peptidase family protein [Cellulomonas sp.]
MTLTLTPRATLVAERTARLLAHLADAPFDAVLTLSAPNVDYATGYRSMSGSVHGTSSVAAVVTGARTVLAGPVADSAPAFDAGIGEDDFVAHGRFYFESAGSAATATRLVDRHPGAAEAIAEAVLRSGLPGDATVGLDDAACPAPLRAALAAALPGVTWVDASAWLSGVRARKLPGEVALLARSARLAEAGIVAALAVARAGVSERELARVVARTMVDGGGLPKFVVVTTGERSALADAEATDRLLAPGDLVRFDVGCLLDGYWSDIGRTGVVGTATAVQSSRYDALLAGVDAQLAAARPGVSAAALFDLAISTTEAGGLAPYRRQHCGHGIGLDVYEAPIVRPGEDVPLEEGMTFCFETPYYELGWGGMMVEDALVVTADGVAPLTTLARGLTEVSA